MTEGADEGKGVGRKARRFYNALAGASRRLAGGFWAFISKPEYTVVVLGLVFGLLILVFTPPFQVCDEPQHLFNAFRISEGRIFPARVGDSAGNNVPRSFKKTYSKVNASELRCTQEGKQDPQQIFDAFRIPLRAGDRVFVASYFQYPPLVYLPQAVGMALGRIFRAPPILLIYLARLFNLLAVLLIAFVTIRVTPVLKWAFFLLFLMPMTLFQSASSSADALTVALAFLATAFFFHLALDPGRRTIEKRDYYLLMALALALGMIKPPYFLLVFMFFLVPWKKFGSGKSYLYTFGLMLLLIMVILVAWHFLAVRDTSIPKLETYSPGRHVAHIMRHPLSFTRAVLDTFRANKFYVKEFVAGIGWFNVRPPAWLGYSFIFALIAVAALDKNDIEVRGRQKAIALGLSLAVCLAVIVVIYSAWNPLDASQIKHINARYFIPPAALAALALYNRRIIYQKGKYFYLAVTALSALFCLETVRLILQRFY